MSKYIWYTGEPEDKCSDDCSQELTGEVLCLDTETMKVAEDSNCKDESSGAGRKPSAPQAQCDCKQDAIRKKAIKMRSEQPIPGETKAITAFGILFLVILLLDIAYFLWKYVCDQ